MPFVDRPLFDSYVMVDWSAAARPRTGVDSIWIAALDRDRRGHPRAPRLRNPPTRHQALDALVDLLRNRLERGLSVLAGFDFPFGYPIGTAAALGLTGSGAPWTRLWDLLAGEITDGPANENNRFEVAAALNERLSGTPFPFWGCPAGAASRFLTSKKFRAHADGDLAERRLCDRATRGTQPVWKLFTTGSVGSQVLMGLPVLETLRRHPEIGRHVTVWPFDTGLAPPRPGHGPSIVLAEIFPSFWVKEFPPDTIRDAVQVAGVVRQLAALDAKGRLAALFNGPAGLEKNRKEAIVSEEAWILGVTEAPPARP